MAQKTRAHQPKAEAPKMQIRGNQVFSPIRQKWVELTPEERVRQEFSLVLTTEYGYSLQQMDEEVSVTGRGSGDARADFLIWRTPTAKTSQEHALIVVECKADNVAISLEDYTQGANYAQYEHARFFVTHNHRETKFWRVDDTRRMPNYDEIAGIPHADASDKEVEELLARLKVFKEDEFADLLHQCHNVIRNREKKDPAAAFDEIAKILFVKVDIERRLRQGTARKNLFTAEFLDEQFQLHDDPMNALFRQTKEDYKADRIFDPDETISLKFNTAREIVKLLERYNLSDTSEDIKGIAFERFLGRTFRGEIGQFFTPRTIVEFMVRMVDPKEKDIICDPASGSGGFLIRFFELARQQILADADADYQTYKSEVESKKSISQAKKAELLSRKFDEIQATLDQRKSGTRLWTLANRCIYGTDANDRMARTSKMNMIMHGDGHGGVHHHDGFLNVNGIFEGRFSVILTNPPFGASVEPSDVILESDVQNSEEDERHYAEAYGDLYREAQARVKAAKNKPIASLFELPQHAKGRDGRVKTEILFIERCLELLQPGGRLGIVLPEDIFNNPSLAYVREFCEDRAFLRAVISLPQETFLSSGASVKASLLFLHKFTTEDKVRFDAERAKAVAEIDAKYAAEIAAKVAEFQAQIVAAKEVGDKDARAAAQKALAGYGKEMAARKTTEARALLKSRFDYPVFMYEAEKVGITATGEADRNELYPNPDMPPGVDKSCLELYRKFLADPKPFLAEASA